MRTHNLPVFAMGLTSILIQIIALRKLLSVFSGNELDIGLTLSVWLIAVGSGSLSGKRFRFNRAFAGSFLMIAVLSLLTVLFMDLIPRVFRLTPGEIIPLSTIMISTVLSLFPLCFIIGLQFPLAVSYLNGNAPKAYGLEATGACIGGVLFTFLLSGRVEAFVLSAAVGALNVLIAWFLYRKKQVLLLLALPLVAYFGMDWTSTSLPTKDFKLVYRVESKYGEIKVLRNRGQSNVFASGQYQFSYPDAQTEELKTHLPMSLHASPSRVLVIGGSPAVVREFLKYPLVSLDFVEMDPELIRVSRGILVPEDQEHMHDKRVRLLTTDARKFIRAISPPFYDIVVLNLPEPATGSINRFYTVEFFHEVRAAMKYDGIFCLSLPASFGYISRSMQLANGSIYRSLREVFDQVAVSSEEYGGMFASKSPVDAAPETAEKRFRSRHIDTKNFYPELFRDILDPRKTNLVSARLTAIESANSDRRPAAYLYNVMLWAEVYGGKAMNAVMGMTWRTVVFVCATLILLMTTIFWKQEEAIYYSLFTTGYSGMSLSLVIILAYQAAYGYVYETLGLMTALFMAGAAAGAAVTGGARRPLHWLRALELSAVLLLIAAPLFFQQEVLFYLLSLLCGMMGGMQFASASGFLAGRNAGQPGGSIYAVELFGSFLGALLTAIVFVPVLGIHRTMIVLILLKVSSLIPLFSFGHENN